jgi:GAF domain-containing protein
MCLDETHGRRFTEDEVSLLAAFSDQAALSLEKARLLNEAETERERADSLYRVSNLLAGVHDTDEVLDLIVNEAARLVGATGAYIRLLVASGLVVSAATKSVAVFVGGLNRALPMEEGLSALGHVLATRKPWVSEDVSKDELTTPEGRTRAENIIFGPERSFLL